MKFKTLLPVFGGEFFFNVIFRRISGMKERSLGSSFIMNKKIIFLNALLFVLIADCRAQWADSLDQILHGKIFPTASFDSRNSFVSSSRAHIWGIKAGVEFSGKLQGGIGYNRHDNNLKKEVYFSDAFGNPDSAKAELHLDYFSFYLRFVYYDKGRWKFSVMPYQLGFGNSRYSYSENGISKISGKKFVVLFEPGISVSFKIFKWFGAGADVGYRIMLRGNKAIPENFNSPIYSFYAIIYWGELFKLTFPDSKFAKKL
ncbi:hypothetical protein BH09BAC5_BH09BAC5_13740 [soil metagenome]